MVNKYHHTTEAELVGFFSEYIDWPKRAKGEQGFFARVLREHGCRTVFDSCLGEGYDSVTLIKEGFDVASNEIDPNFRDKGCANAEEHGIELKLTPGYDWREIPDRLCSSFDSVICLGNSLTYLFDRKDQERALENFRKIVRPGGLVIVDQRNYDYMLKNRDEILKDPRKNFRYSRRFYYCGTEIDSYPVHIDDNLVVLEFHQKRTGIETRLKLYPFRRDELRSLMQECGLDVLTYGDFELDRTGDVDFYQHVGIRK
jgi:SAM-dependent methyltransferase